MKGLFAMALAGSIAMTSMTAGAATNSVTINAANFPDSNFRSYVSEEIDTNSDGVLSGREINNCTKIDVRFCEISDLKGIEHFKALNILYCGDNQLTSLDVSSNTTLTELYCQNNQLKSLDVSGCASLTKLTCYGNLLKNIDISKNTLLTYFSCYSNRFTDFDLSKNTALTKLYCHHNLLISLDVSNNTALEQLQCANNHLSSLDTSKNTKLTKLWCQDNLLTSLDASLNTALTELECYRNELTSLKVSGCTKLTTLNCYNNQLTSLNVSKNTALKELWCSDNRLKKLNVSKNTALTKLWCSGNRLTSIDVSKNPALTDFACSYNIYALSDISLNELTPYGFDPAKASSWTGANYNAATNSLTKITAEEVTYVYDVGNGKTATFTLIPTNYSYIKAHSLTLGDDIGVKFYIKIADNIIADESACVKFTVNGRESTLYVKDVNCDSYYGYEFVCPVAAAEMNDTIKGQLYVGGKATGDPFYYSVKTYADYILANSEEYADEIPLVNAMLNYGAAAEKYFRGSTEMNFTKPVVDASLLAAYKFTVNDNDSAIDYMGQVISLKNKVTAKLYFSGGNLSVNDFKVTQNGAAVESSRLTVGSDTKGTYLAISDIAADKMGEPFEITVGGVTISNYSVFSYVQGAINSSTDGLSDVVSALYAYGSAAESYSKL